MNRTNINGIHATALGLLVSFLLIRPSIEAAEWNRFLGPHQNGTLERASLPDHWPDEGPQQLWRRPVGSGFAGPIVVNGQVVLFQREKNQEKIDTFDAKSGAPGWSFSYPTTYRDDFGFDNGPRSTPTADGDFLYTYGAQGRLQCLNVKTGDPVWHVDCKDKFGAPKGFFGIACSPLVDGDLVLVNVGSPTEGGIVAFDRLTGAVKWTVSTDPASYSSPVITQIESERLALFFDREGLKTIELPTGILRSQYPWRPRINASVNAASPVIKGSQVFLTTSYNQGAIVLDLSGSQPEKIWSNDDALSCHYGTPVRHDDYLYGFHGRQEFGAALHCVSWSTGKVMWRENNVAIGTLMLLDGKLLILQENGELVLAHATPDQYQELDRAQILNRGVRAYPAYTDGVIYARSPDRLVAFQVGN